MGWTLSAVFHGIVVAALVFLATLAAKVKPLDVVSTSIVPVNVVDFSDYSNVKAIAVEAPTAPEDQPDAKGAPQPEEAIEEDAEPIPDPHAKPLKKPDKPRTKPNLDQMAEMLNRAEKNSGQSRDQTASDAERGPNPRAGAGLRNALTVSEMDYMVSRLERCWRSNADSENTTKIVVRVQLNKDGTLKGEPVVMAPANIAGADVSTKVLARRAVNAVKECGPYKEFKQDRYAYWRLFDLRMGADAIQ
jgi:hypothetical protein